MDGLFVLSNHHLAVLGLIGLRFFFIVCSCEFFVLGFKFQLGIDIYVVIILYRTEIFYVASHMSHVLQKEITPTEIWPSEKYIIH